MRNRIEFNDNWLFHMGEFDTPVPKVTGKTGTCGGASNLTAKEGFVYRYHPHLAALMRKESANDLYNVADDLEGLWEKAVLPHDWSMLLVPVAPVGKVSTARQIEAGYLEGGVAYYRKVFSVAGESHRRRFFIEFEGVMMDSTVWVNGCFIGSHLSGYTGFAYDISDYLFYGNEGENIILVKTETHLKEGWWAEGAGIYRNVWLTEVPCVHVKRNGAFVYSRFPDSDNRYKVCSINVEVEIENSSFNQYDFTVKNILISPDGLALSATEIASSLEKVSEGKIQDAFTLEGPLLWDLESPKLYAMRTEILVQGEVMDVVETSFGIRDIEYTQEGLVLNGRHIEIKGVGVHQDAAVVGVALTPEIIDFRLNKIKEMGANAYRSAHNPATDYLLSACDRLGILVLNENRRFGSSAENLEELSEMIKSSRNHPSIFMWSLENEEFIASLPNGRRILKSLAEHAKALDPTRPATMAGHFAIRDELYNAIPAVAGFNYDMDDAAAMKAAIPGLLTIGTEDSSYLSTRGIYADDRTEGYCDSYDSGSYLAKMILEKMSDEQKAQISVGTLGGALSPGCLAYSWKHYKENAPFLGGIFAWTAFDYRGETTPWNWPAVISQYGAMDICGFEKDAFYFWQSCWLDRPMVHMLPHWNHPGKEGTMIQIDAYSSCEEIELFLNGVSQGRKAHTKGLISSWNVIYEPGNARMVAYNNGRIAAEDEIITAGESHAIRLSLMHKGDKEALLKAEITDGSGYVCPTSDNEISFSIRNDEGKEDRFRILGTANGNPANHEMAGKSSIRAFNGLAQVIIASDKPVSDGENQVSGVTIAAASEGLICGSIKL